MELTQDQIDRLSTILTRVQQARRELDALIGDNYLSQRASVVGVHFNYLAAAVEKLRWAEAEWLELLKELPELQPP